MTPRFAVGALLASLFFFLGSATRSPNIVIFLVDDFGWGDVGANWGSTTSTPNMDSIAKDGLRLTDFHAAASYCTPSRAALLTGRLGLRTGVTKLFGSSSVGGLPDTEVTIADVLKDAGYETFAIGKWHLGHRALFNPIKHGFDHYFGVPYSLDNGCLSYPGINYPRCPPCGQSNISEAVDGDFLDANGICYVSSTALPLFRDDTIVEQPLDLRKLSSQYVQEFKKQVLSAKSANRPFFGYVPFSHMHVPHGHADEYAGVSQRGVWFDTLSELDDTVGEMVRTLKDNGLDNDTFVFLFGDNGPWEEKCNYAGSTGPYQGLYQKLRAGGGATSKFTTWEGGHRVPGIAYWPGKIKPGVSHSLVGAMDLFPTVVKLAGAKMPEDRDFDGVDISEVLFREREAVTRKILFHPQIEDGNLTAARHGNYKIIYAAGGELYSRSCGGKSSPVTVYDPPLLFDLRSDPAEEIPLDTSLAKHKSILREVQLALKHKMADIEHDKRSKVDWRSDPSVMPCCNPRHPHCFCK